MTNSADKIADATKRLRETRADIDRLPPSPAKDKALAELARVVTDFARGVRERTKRT
jgi:hypothetical protein